MKKPGRRAQLVAVLIGVFVLASLAVAVASGRIGGDDEFAVDSSEPAATDQAAVAGDSVPAGDLPLIDPAPGQVDPVPGTGSGTKPIITTDPGVTSTALPPDAPVSSDDKPAPPPAIVSDPPDAFTGIRNFEQCAAAGYPVMESYPEQCRTPDGRLFVRVID